MARRLARPHLAPLLKNPAADWPHPCLYEHTGHDFGNDVAKVLRTHPMEAIYQKVPWYTAVVQHGWKYILYLPPGVPEELYDLDSDPEELNNLAAEPAHAAKLAAPRETLAAELKRTNAATELLSQPVGKP